MDFSAESSIRVDVKKLDTLTTLVGDEHRHQLKMAQTLRYFQEIGESIHRITVRLQTEAASVHPRESSREQISEMHFQLRESITDLRTIHTQLLSILSRALDGAFEGSNRMQEVEDAVRELRLLPLSALFARYPRSIRDLASEQGKRIHVMTKDAQIEVDKQVLDHIAEPLLHLIRNAVDHGIELPVERKARGKNEEGMIALIAKQIGPYVDIRITDDGRGLSLDAIRTTAITRGVLSEIEAKSMPESEIFRLIFLPGFSTRRQATDVSGRGIGMDVVREQVEHLGGSVHLSSKLGEGTTISLRVPFSVAIMSVLVIQVDRTHVALPAHSVLAVADIKNENIQAAGNGMAYRFDGELIPVYEFPLLLGLRQPEKPQKQGQQVVIIENDGRRIGLLGARVLGQRGVVQRPMDPFLGANSLLTGAAVLEQGEPALILGISELMRNADDFSRIHTPVQAKKTSERETQRCLLLVEDSEVVRDTLVGMLRPMGHLIIEARNGEEGLRRVEEHQPDLIVTDLEMPVIDGFELISRVRAAAGSRNTPIIVLSSRGSDQDKKRAGELGADVYLVKSEFSQELLTDAINRFLESESTESL